jgi:uncharacterized membrane protein YGL010W
MAFKLRKPSVVEMLVQVILLAPWAVFVYDFAVALGETACTAPGASADCYPWGSEGFWYYQTKAAYLSSVAVSILVLSLAFAIPFLARTRATSWLLIALTFIAAYFLTQPLAGLIEPLMPVS